MQTNILERRVFLESVSVLPQPFSCEHGAREFAIQKREGSLKVTRRNVYFVLPPDLLLVAEYLPHR